MKGDIFAAIYSSPYINKRILKRLPKPIIKYRWTGGTLHFEAGKIMQAYCIIENGLLRSFVIDYNGNEVTTEFYCPGSLLIESFSLFHKSPSRKIFRPSPTAPSGESIIRLSNNC